MKLTRTKAEIIMILTVAAWGASFLLTKQIMREIAVFNFMSLRFLMGCAILAGILLIKGQRSLTLEQLKGGIITGGVLFVAMALHTIGLSMTSIAKNAFIVGGSVIFVPIISSVVFKERQSPLIWFCTILALVGLGFITLDGQQGGINLGDALTLLGSIAMAYFIILVEQYVKKQDPLVMTTVQIGVVGSLSLAVSFLVEAPSANLSSQSWMAMLFLGIICTAVGYMLSNISQKHIPASNVGLIYTLEPIFASILGWLFLSEVLGVTALTGAGMIIVSVTLPNMGRQLKKQKLLREIAKDIKLGA